MRGRQEKGQAILELALIVPLLTIIFLGMHQFSRITLLQQKNLMAARQAAFLRAHSNMSYREIAEEAGGAEKFNISIGSAASSLFTLVDLGPINEIVNKYGGVYEVRSSYQVQTLPIFEKVLPRRIQLKTKYTMTRGAWAEMWKTLQAMLASVFGIGGT